MGFEDGADLLVVGGDFEELFGCGDVGTDDFVLGAARLLGLGLGGGGNGRWGGLGPDGFLLDYQEAVGNDGGCQAGNAAKLGGGASFGVFNRE